MDITDGRTNKRKLGFSVDTVHFQIPALLLIYNNPWNTKKNNISKFETSGFFFLSKLITTATMQRQCVQ